MLFRKEGWIVEDIEERMYIYMQKMDGREQYGIVAMASVDDYESGLIKRHELTIKKKEEDRTRLSDTQNANLGPVFLTFKDGETIEKRMMDIVATQAPYASVHGSDDTDHVLWQCSVEDSAFFTQEFAGIPCTYIADGHHRAASAFNVGKMRRAAAIERGEALTGEEPFMFLMSINFPESNLKIMDYNRALKSLNGMAPADFIARVEESYEVTLLADGADPKPTQKGDSSMYIEGHWYNLRVRQERLDHSNLIKMLDS